MNGVKSGAFSEKIDDDPSMALSNAWRVGFEIEIVLGDLGRPVAFDPDDPMDEASPAYCQTVAKSLRELTGYPWSAPIGKKAKPGFYVLPEYGLDPLHWPRGLVGGVELLTPPLPIEEAEEVREQIADAILMLDGWFNCERNPITFEFGWHINVDAGPSQPLDPDKFMLAADEIAVLVANCRYPSVYAAPQHHRYGIPLLRHLREEPSAELLMRPNLDNFLNVNAGKGKRFAANFAKLDVGYLELRHFATPMFMSETPLKYLLAPLLIPFQMDNDAEQRFAEYKLQLFRILASWAEQVRPRLKHVWDPPGAMVSSRHGQIYIDDEPLARTVWTGTMDIHLAGSKNWPEPALIQNIPYSDMYDAVALLALDVAQINVGQRRTGIPIASSKFRAEISNLRRSLRSAKLLTPPTIGLSPYWDP